MSKRVENYALNLPTRGFCVGLDGKQKPSEWAAPALLWTPTCHGHEEPLGYQYCACSFKEPWERPPATVLCPQ